MRGFGLIADYLRQGAVWDVFDILLKEMIEFPSSCVLLYELLINNMSLFMIICRKLDFFGS